MNTQLFFPKAQPMFQNPQLIPQNNHCSLVQNRLRLIHPNTYVLPTQAQVVVGQLNQAHGIGFLPPLVAY